MLLVLTLYFVNPKESNPFSKAIFLSYPLDRDDPLIPQWTRQEPNQPTYYGKGIADIAFVLFYTVVLSFTREVIMQLFLRPLAKSYGIRSRGKQSRFMEQAYTAIYFVVAGPLGLYVMSRTPVWYFNTNAFYEQFPHRSHDGWFKAYYLIEASYWAQQAIVLLLRLEAPRKDYYELVGHHIVTLALIALSYRFHFTYIGIAVYVTHDISDFFLAVSRLFECRILLMIIDCQNAQLYRLQCYCTILCLLHGCLGLHAPLSQYVLLVVSFDKLPDGRAL